MATLIPAVSNKGLGFGRRVAMILAMPKRIQASVVAVCAGPRVYALVPVEQHVVYSIYYMNTLVLPYIGEERGLLDRDDCGLRTRDINHIRHMEHGYIYKIHNMTVTAIQRD